MDNVQETFDRMTELVKGTQNYLHRRDLLRLYRSCENIHFAITNEMVECRRRKLKSAKLEQLEKDFEAAVETFDQWVTFSRLLG